MNDRLSGEANASDADLESLLGTRDALLALWQPVALTCDDSSIITAPSQTRSRLVLAHLVVHDLLRADHHQAMDRLAAMSPLMTTFTALRSLTLASELLWHTTQSTWQQVLDDAQAQSAAVLAADPNGGQSGADAMAKAIAGNLDGDDQQRILDCVVDVTSTQSPPARCGVATFGAGVLVAALKITSEGTLDDVIEEHAALLIALAHARAITHLNGRLVTDD